MAIGSQTVWQPVETMPNTGRFLIGVWEGEWKEPRQRFRIYEAQACLKGPVWGVSYRTAEGEAYEIVCWMEKPMPPGTKWRSIAIWPNTIKVGNTIGKNESDDIHATREAAEAVCNLLRKHGFGGNGEVFPISTRVEPVWN